jgi:low temperature requirement protein LtrA
VQTLAGGALALAGTLCLWWLYFHAEPIALRHAARTEDRVYASRMGTNGLFFMIAGLIALAAGNALVIDHPAAEATLAVALMLCGGPGVFLLARTWYQRRVFTTAAPRSQLLTIGVLVTTVAALRTAPALVAALAPVAVLAALVIVEHPNFARKCRCPGGGGTSAGN